MRSLLIALWLRSRPHEPQAAADIFVAVSKKAFIATLVLAGVTAIFGCLAVVAANGPQCAGYELMEGYGSRAFVGLFFWSGSMAFMVSRIAFATPHMRERLEASFERDVQFTHNDTSFEMTDGVFTAYVVLLLIGALSVAPTVMTITHYLALLNDCPLLAVPH